MSVDRSQGQIMALLRRFGVGRIDFDFDAGAVGFVLDGQMYLLRPRPLPVQFSPRAVRSQKELEEQAVMQSWRILHDYIEGVVKYAWFMNARASLLQFLVLPNGQTAGDIDPALLTGNVLPAPAADSQPIDVEVTVIAPDAKEEGS